MRRARRPAAWLAVVVLALGAASAGAQQTPPHRPSCPRRKPAEDARCGSSLDCTYPGGPYYCHCRATARGRRWHCEAGDDPAPSPLDL